MNKFLVKTTRYAKRYAPEILTGLAVIGTITTAVLTGLATVKALNIIDEATGDRDVPLTDTESVVAPVELTKTETVSLVWTCYIPPVIVGLSTIFCIVESGNISRHRQKNLASAYALVNTAFSEYRAKNVELYGPEPDLKVRTSVTEDHLMKSGKLHKPADGKILVCEEISNWFFDTTMAELIDAELQINKKFTENGEAALNEFYEFLGIPTCDFGEELGWEHWCTLQMNGVSWLNFEHELHTLDDGSEYYVISCKTKPYAFNYPYEPNLPFDNED